MPEAIGETSFPAFLAALEKIAEELTYIRQNMQQISQTLEYIAEKHARIAAKV